MLAFSCTCLVTIEKNRHTVSRIVPVAAKQLDGSPKACEHVPKSLRRQKAPLVSWVAGPESVLPDLLAASMTSLLATVMLLFQKSRQFWGIFNRWDGPGC